MSPPTLSATPIVRGVYLVTAGGSHGAMTTGVALRALELAMGRAAVDDQPLKLPGWTAPLIEAPVAFQRSTVVFLDEDAHRRFDWFEQNKFVRLGVSRVILPDPSAPPTVVELRFQSSGFLRRTWNHNRLRRRAVATAGALPNPGSVQIQPEAGHMMSAGPFAEIVTPAGAQGCWEYLAFEGDRALPPLERMHDEIRAEGGGRYSVYNQHLFVSETEPGRAERETYWIARRTPENERLLPVSALRPIPTEARLREEQSAFRSLLNRAKRPIRLEAGDRVVVCTHSLAAGGAERQWAFLAQGLKARGLDVTFVVYEPLEGEARHYLHLVEDAGVPVVDASAIAPSRQLALYPKTPEALGQLRDGIVPFPDKLLRLTAAFAELRPKAVFAQLDGGNLLAGVAAHLVGAERVVMSFRNYNPTHFPYLHTDWQRPAYRALSESPRVLYSGNNKGANDDYAAWIGIDPSLPRFIANAVDAEAFPEPSPVEVARLRTELGLGADTPVVLGAFRISAEKDPGAFVETAIRLLQARPALVVLHAGAGVWEPAAEQLAQAGLTDRLRFLGRRSDINVLLKLANVFLLTSLKEGMPNVVAEAQLMACPVVATATDGTSNVVLDGKTALLCPTGDAPALAAACLRLLDDPEDARQMGEAGRAFVISSFQKSRMADGYVRLVNGDAPAA